ncbi:MAG: hypothetical protein IKZ64_01380, partial [Alphaproteobacteria bacterium]|nr:hypothetical protein [Alphaproteobacteria bacterium]
MKKLALTSLLALFAVSGANAATNHFVGGGFGIKTDSKHDSSFSLTPEFGWKLNSNWDTGFAAEFVYDHHLLQRTSGVDGDYYVYGIEGFARYKIAQMGKVKLLLRGDVGAAFATISSDNDNIDGESLWAISSDIVPMVTYDVSESFTLYARLNFLGVHVDYYG